MVISLNAIMFYFGIGCGVCSFLLAANYFKFGRITNHDLGYSLMLTFAWLPLFFSWLIFELIGREKVIFTRDK